MSITYRTWPSFIVKVELYVAMPLTHCCNAVTSQTDARAVVLDLSGVEELEGGGLGMLVFLRQWARDHGIQLKLFNPSRFVRQRLERAGLSCIFDVASIGDVLALFDSGKGRYAMAS